MHRQHPSAVSAVSQVTTPVARDTGALPQHRLAAWLLQGRDIGRPLVVEPLPERPEVRRQRRPGFRPEIRHPQIAGGLVEGIQQRHRIGGHGDRQCAAPGKLNDEVTIGSEKSLTRREIDGSGRPAGALGHYATGASPRAAARSRVALPVIRRRLPEGNPRDRHRSPRSQGHLGDHRHCCRDRLRVRP
jgi:hypothetical protein